MIDNITDNYRKVLWKFTEHFISFDYLIIS